MYEVGKSCVKLQNHILVTGHFPINLGVKQGDNRNQTYLKYKRRWIKAIFLQDKHNINAVSLNIKFMCIWHKTGERLYKPHLYPSYER
jgi:hypothetical protein